jgi:hypothetical protein
VATIVAQKQEIPASANERKGSGEEVVRTDVRQCEKIRSRIRAFVEDINVTANKNAERRKITVVFITNSS